MPKKSYSKRPKMRRRSWKQLQRRKKLKRRLRLLALSFIVLFAGTFFYSFLKVWDSFAHLATQADASSFFNLPAPDSTKESYALFLARRQETANGDWVLAESKLLVVNKTAPKAILFSLPSDLPLRTTEFGDISLGGAGRLLQNDSITQLLLSMEDSFRIPLAGVFISWGNSASARFSLTDPSPLTSLSVLYQAKSFSRQVYTNLTSGQLLGQILFLKGLRATERDEVGWDPALARASLVRDSFLKESLRLEIVNNSSLEGIASREADKLSSLGVKVAKVTPALVFHREIISQQGDPSANLLILKSPAFKKLRTVSYLIARYHADVVYSSDMQYPASLVLSDAELY